MTIKPTADQYGWFSSNLTRDTTHTLFTAENLPQFNLIAIFQKISVGDKFKLRQMFGGEDFVTQEIPLLFLS